MPVQLCPLRSFIIKIRLMSVAFCIPINLYDQAQICHASLFIYLFIFLFIYLFICLCIYLFIYLRELVISY
jgi:hypothetical protein